MPHPFERIPAGRRRTMLLVLAAATTVLLGILGRYYRALNDSTAPQGMMSLELAWTGENVARMLDSWTAEIRMQLAFSLGLNFLCLFTLTNALAMACAAAAAGVRSRLMAAVGSLLAWGQWIAGACWLVQNSLLLRAVLSHGSEGNMTIASGLSSLKFALTGAGLLFAVAGGIAKLFLPAARPIETTSPAQSKSQSA